MTNLAGKKRDIETLDAGQLMFDRVIVDDTGIIIAQKDALINIENNAKFCMILVSALVVVSFDLREL